MTDLTVNTSDAANGLMLTLDQETLPGSFLLSFSFLGQA